MTTFIAIYRGSTISAAKLIAVSADPALVAHCVSCLLGNAETENDDPVISAFEEGRQRALQIIARFSSQDTTAE